MVCESIWQQTVFSTPYFNCYFKLKFLFYAASVVRMNGVVKTDESDSLAGDMPESAAAKPGQESAVIQPPGIGPAIHLNGSACPVQEDQPVQVGVKAWY